MNVSGYGVALLLAAAFAFRPALGAEHFSLKRQLTPPVVSGDSVGVTNICERSCGNKLDNCVFNAKRNKNNPNHLVIYRACFSTYQVCKYKCGH